MGPEMNAREIYDAAYAEALAENLDGQRIEDLAPADAEQAREYAHEFAIGEVEAAHELGCTRRPACDFEVNR